MNQKANPKVKTGSVILEFVLIFDLFRIWTSTFVWPERAPSRTSGIGGVPAYRQAGRGTI